METKTKTRMVLPDLLRGLAVIFMAQVHMLNVYANDTVTHSVWAEIIDFMGGPPAAPVFMMVMGFFFLLKKPAPAVAMKRGLSLLALGYGLNFLRGFLPLTLALDVFGYEPAYFPAMYTRYYMLFTVDILIFAGLAFIGMSLITSISEKPLYLAAVALVVAVVSPFLWGLGADVPVLRYVLNPIWGADMDLVTFPFFPWIFYPIMGMIAAAVYRKGMLKEHVFKVSLLAGVVFFIAGGILLLIDFDRFYNDYGQQRIGALLGFCGIVFLWGILVWWFDRVYPRQWKTGILRYLSRNLTTVYVIHWLILGWGMLIIQPHTLSLVWVLLGTMLLTGLACVVTELFKRTKMKKQAV